MPFTPTISIAIALALAPALITWWTGRAVLTRIDDPALPELLVERRRRLSLIAFGGAMLLAVMFTSDAIWALPLLWTALLASSYPLRRALFAERWSLFAYLRFSIWSSIGQAGLWLFAAFAPSIITSFALGLAPEGGIAAQRIAAWAGAVAAVIIALWSNQYARVWLAFHRATPLRDALRPELMARLDAILAKAKPTLARIPALYRFGPSGGHVVNALAIPSLAMPAVAMSDGLLTTLTDDEIAAVFAHEIAHHEQFAKRPAWRRWVALLILVVTIAALPAALLEIGPSAAFLGGSMLPLTFLAAFGLRSASQGGARTKQRDAETASDLRAAELTGDVEAMASALIKLHAYNRVPRRWSSGMERSATHPSVARRVQALRERFASADATAAATPMTIVRSASGDAVLAFDTQRAYWFEGVPADVPLALDALRAAASSYRAVAYGDLAELRIAAAGDERTLIAIDRQGHSWTAAIALADVAAIQTTLDRVDGKLGRRPIALRPVGVQAARLLAIALLVALTAAGEAGVAFVPILFLLFRPGITAAVAAAGAIGISRVLVMARNVGWVDSIRQLGVISTLIVAGLLLGLTVMRIRADEQRRTPARKVSRETWLLIVLLAGTGALFIAAVLPLAVERPESLLSNALAVSITTIVAGLAAAIATLPGRLLRFGGGLTSLAAVVGGLLLSGDGWLFDRTPSLTWSKGSLVPAGIVPIQGGALTLGVSANGSSFFVTQYYAGRRGAAATNRYLIGRFDDRGHTSILRPSNAVSLVFLDDETLLAVEQVNGDSVELRAERLTADSLTPAIVLWREALPRIDNPRVIVDRARKAWTVVGHDGDGSMTFVVVSDTIGGVHPRTYRWSSSFGEDIGESLTTPLVAFADGSVIWSTLSGLRDTGTSLEAMLLMMSAAPRWELRRTSAAGERFVAAMVGLPTCSSNVGKHGALCAETSSRRQSRIWRVDPAGRTVRLADLPAAFNIVRTSDSSQVAAADQFGDQAAVIDLATRQARRLTLPTGPYRADNPRWTFDIVAAGPYVVLLSSGRDGASVRRYRLD